MNVSSSWQQAVVAALSASSATGAGIASPSWSRIGRNALTSSWSLAFRSSRFFVKLTQRENAFALEAEADALRAIAATRAIRIPQVVVSGESASNAFLVLEWIDIVDGGRDASLGRGLARMHAETSSSFGWHRDNTIGPTPQANGWCDDWATFFRDQRLRPQLELAARKGCRDRLPREGARLLERIPRLLEGHRPAASLLHGDLWAGNAGQTADGSPLIYDPATYYGDRETDLAMTELFGGFGHSFYTAYAQTWPLPADYETRRTLYNLYHVLNHRNLFGDAYLVRAERMVAELLALR